jgi:hypothetical protein
MLQIQLEIDSRVFWEKHKTNRIDIIANSVKEAIAIASKIDPDICIIMPEYMVPIEQCTDYDYTNTLLNERFFVMSKAMKAKPGWIMDSGSRINESLTRKFLYDVDIDSLESLSPALEENLDDLGIYMLDEDVVEKEMSGIDNED